MNDLNPQVLSEQRQNSVAASFRGVSKRYGSVVAVDDVSLDVVSGRVHAILGENGAGKTTLMRILSGVVQPDTGNLQVHGRVVRISSPRNAKALGIGMVHQQPALLPALTVAENLLLDDNTAPALFQPKRYGDLVAKQAAEFGFEITPDRPVGQLSMAERQVLELCRVLMRGYSVLILDEPTAYLGPVDGDRLLERIYSLSREGTAVLLVTHKLREIEAFADEVTVLRGGRRILTQAVSDISSTSLMRAMVGPDVTSSAATPQQLDSTARRETVLRLEEVTIPRRDGRMACEGWNLEVHRGSIVGIAGLYGVGQDEVATVLAKLEGPSAGRVVFGDSSTTIAYVPADRVGTAAPPELTIEENLTLRDYRESGFSRLGVLDSDALRSLAGERATRFQIRYGSLDDPTATLSGGNIQRMILAREFGRSFDLLIAHNPTAGLDVSGTSFVRNAIRRAAFVGAGVVLISDDLDEIVELSSAVYVLSQSRCLRVPDALMSDRLAIGTMMTGALPQPSAYA